MLCVDLRYQYLHGAAALPILYEASDALLPTDNRQLAVHCICSKALL